jgi:hypothetical protein
MDSKMRCFEGEVSPLGRGVRKGNVTFSQADRVTGREENTVAGRKGARKSQSGCEEITVEIAPVLAIV